MVTGGSNGCGSNCRKKREENTEGAGGRNKEGEEKRRETLLRSKEGLAGRSQERNI